MRVSRVLNQKKVQRIFGPKEPLILAFYTNTFCNVTFITLAFCEKEGSVEVIGLETANAFMDSVTGLNAGEEISNKSAISDIRSDLEIDERDDKLALFDPLTT
ncbi:uncharacterized protein OCT59_022220 [Rhizophagus irregularis]|uniref:uncharacterized protein n=1 Tax=Rhizophagus irregularis TaxID=588596 RepID=UPI0019E9E919|nr:hypothetical protein OCT59_022220 [Rhizophagus irregularis]GET56308.1 hypothetical protein RIR_jg36890.t1 [Rhizophagus irregularis DAOM 181602=DAOM 197198]